MKKQYPKSFLAKLNSVTSKRPKTVIQHILANGFVTTEELKNLGYEHAPRAARDVRELGIPLETFRIKDSSGRSIAAYRFGDPTKSSDGISKKAGRTVLSKSLKKALVEKYGSVCFIYLQPMESNLLQVDHRVPYEIGGEQDPANLDCYMLLCPSQTGLSHGHANTAQTGGTEMLTFVLNASGPIQKAILMLQARSKGKS